jgi:hypothetical protein
MPKNKAPRVVWLYEKSHLKQPFIRIGLESLVEAGYNVTLINMLSAREKKAPYHHIPLLKRPANSLFRNLLLKEYGAYRFGFLLPAVMLRHAMLQKPEIVITTLPVGLTVGLILKKVDGGSSFEARSGCANYPK